MGCLQILMVVLKKLQQVINGAWSKINNDINATIDKIFDTHFPNAIKKFLRHLIRKYQNLLKQ